MPDAIALGLLDVINRTQGTAFTPDQFLSNCRARAGSEEVYQQSYLCNPMGAAVNHIVDWSSIERCRFDYSIHRVHLEADQLRQLFGEFSPGSELNRHTKIHDFLHDHFPLSRPTGEGLGGVRGGIPGGIPPPRGRRKRFQIQLDWSKIAGDKCC